MTADKILENAGVRGALDRSIAAREVKGLAYDSRRSEEEFLFFAFPGAKVDGRAYADEALRKGALAIVSELPAPDGFKGPWIEVAHGRRALATAAKACYNRIDERLRLTGITGTNGKTTTCFLADAILRAAGHVTGLIGTIEYRQGDRVFPAANTTPESLDTFRFLDQLAAAGGTHLTMEVSSHAEALGRVYSLYYWLAIFTNLTRDHLDYHGTMERYLAAKRMLFAPEGVEHPKFAVTNADDPHGLAVVEGTTAAVVTYGITGNAEAKAKNISSTFDGLSFSLKFRGEDLTLRSRMTGTINVYNVLAASTAMLAGGVPADAVEEGIWNCAAVPGRFERVDAGQPFLVIVDYAHTDDALRNVIRVARGLTSGRVITLFGCGGDRDRAKRPLMGMAAAEASDFVVLTSDNPRSEDPIAIINDATVGLRRFDTPNAIEPDRAAAIRIAMEQAKPGDIVLLAGKGHENYQVLKDKTIHFDDREAARAALKELGFEK